MIDGLKLKNDCVQWIRDWFAANDPECLEWALVVNQKWTKLFQINTRKIYLKCNPFLLLKFKEKNI